MTKFNVASVSCWFCLLMILPGSVLTQDTQDSPATAVITGRIAGYPSDWFPPMYIYARNLDSRSTFSVYSGGSLDFNADITYSITVTEPGNYILFAWTDPEYSGVLVGALYGDHDSIGVLIPHPVVINLGQTVSDIDFQGMMFNIDQDIVPLP